MISQRTQQFLALSLLVFAFVATGCGAESQRLRDERNALFAQNQEAQQLIDDLRRANDALNMENQQLRNDLAGGGAPVPQVDPFAGVEGGVETTIGATSIAVSVPGDLLFAPGKVEISTASRKTLSQIAAIINREYPGRRVRVEGYTDTDPISKSKWADNLELSLQRSAAVYRFLDEQGIEPELMYAAGFGSQKARESKQLSRRVEIVVLLGEN